MRDTSGHFATRWDKYFKPAADRDRNRAGIGVALCPTMSDIAKTARTLVLLALLFTGAHTASALSLEELHRDNSLTPERLAAQFANFKFELRAEIQPARQFLARAAGDCDDFATLAADVLRAKGYTPHLIEIRMPGYLHAVCYIEETRSYLDFNVRGERRPSVACNGSLTDIASKVARSFNTEWTAVSEFSWRRGDERTLQTVQRNGQHTIAANAVATAAPKATATTTATIRAAHSARRIIPNF